MNRIILEGLRKIMGMERSVVYPTEVEARLVQRRISTKVTQDLLLLGISRIQTASSVVIEIIDL